MPPAGALITHAESYKLLVPRFDRFAEPTHGAHLSIHTDLMDAEEVVT
jgi:hypothetical protein